VELCRAVLSLLFYDFNLMADESGRENFLFRKDPRRTERSTAKQKATRFPIRLDTQKIEKLAALRLFAIK
jgi:hypothetical protein